MVKIKWWIKLERYKKRVQRLMHHPIKQKNYSPQRHGEINDKRILKTKKGKTKIQNEQNMNRKIA
jgi:hypothetical protein